MYLSKDDIRPFLEVMDNLKDSLSEELGGNRVNYFNEGKWPDLEIYLSWYSPINAMCSFIFIYDSETSDFAGGFKVVHNGGYLVEKEVSTLQDFTALSKYAFTWHAKERKIKKKK